MLSIYTPAGLLTIEFKVEVLKTTGHVLMSLPTVAIFADGDENVVFLYIPEIKHILSLSILV